MTMEAEILDPIKFDVDHDRGSTNGKKWKNCKYVSMDVLNNWNGFGYLVWPEEGEFDTKGNFQFFDHFPNFEPLLVDRNSAKLVIELAKVSPGANAMLTGKAMEERCWFLAVAKTAWKFASF
jgi:hypothetical protein